MHKYVINQKILEDSTMPKPPPPSPSNEDQTASPAPDVTFTNVDLIFGHNLTLANTSVIIQPVLIKQDEIDETQPILIEQNKIDTAKAPDFSTMDLTESPLDKFERNPSTRNEAPIRVLKLSELAPEDRQLFYTDSNDLKKPTLLDVEAYQERYKLSRESLPTDSDSDKYKAIKEAKKFISTLDNLKKADGTTSAWTDTIFGLPLLQRLLNEITEEDPPGVSRYHNIGDLWEESMDTDTSTAEWVKHLGPILDTDWVQQESFEAWAQALSEHDFFNLLSSASVIKDHFPDQYTTLQSNILRLLITRKRETLDQQDLTPQQKYDLTLRTIASSVHLVNNTRDMTPEQQNTILRQSGARGILTNLDQAIDPLEKALKRITDHYPPGVLRYNEIGTLLNRTQDADEKKKLVRYIKPILEADWVQKESFEAWAQALSENDFSVVLYYTKDFEPLFTDQHTTLQSNILRLLIKRNRETPDQEDITPQQKVDSTVRAIHAFKKMVDSNASTKQLTPEQMVAILTQSSAITTLKDSLFTTNGKYQNLIFPDLRFTYMGGTINEIEWFVPITISIANAEDAEYQGATIGNVEMTGTGNPNSINLKQTTFRGCALEHVSFNTCNLTGASFIGSNLHTVQFTNSTLTGALFSACTLPEPQAFLGTLFAAINPNSSNETPYDFLKAMNKYSSGDTPLAATRALLQDYVDSGHKSFQIFSARGPFAWRTHKNIVHEVLQNEAHTTPHDMIHDCINQLPSNHSVKADGALATRLDFLIKQYVNPSQQKDLQAQLSNKYSGQQPQAAPEPPTP